MLSKHRRRGNAAWMAFVALAAILALGTPARAELAFDRTDYVSGGNTTLSVGIGDFDHNGHLDLAAANGNSNDLSVFLNSGAGSFGGRVVYPTGSGPRSVQVVDLNRDGHLDVAVAVFTGISVLYGNGSGALGSRTDLAAVSGSGSNAVTPVDVDHDGWLDLISANANLGTCSLFRGSATGFGSRVDITVGSGPMDVQAADLNADTHADIVVVRRLADRVTVLLGNGDGTFGAPSDFVTGHQPVSLAVGDLDADDHLDVVTADRGPAHAADSTVSVLVGVGDGTLAAPISLATRRGPEAVIIADLDSDGAMDIGVVYVFGMMSVLRGNGDASFQPKLDFVTGGSPRGLASADLDGDAFLDVATANYQEHSVTVLLNTAEPVLAVGPRNGELALSIAPNPAFEAVTFGLVLPAGGRARLEVLDLKGRRMVTLIDRDVPAGSMTASWMGIHNGHRATPGIYLARLVTARHVLSRKFVWAR